MYECVNTCLDFLYVVTSEEPYLEVKMGMCQTKKYVCFRLPTLNFLLSFLVFYNRFFSQKVFSVSSLFLLQPILKKNFSKSVFVTFARS